MPLDVSFMGPLKTYFSQATERFLKSNPGKVVTLNEISSLLGDAFGKAATMSNAISGFQKTGIHPFNRFIFKDEFAPSKVTDVSTLSGPSVNDCDFEPSFFGFDETDREIEENIIPMEHSLVQATVWNESILEQSICSKEKSNTEGFNIKPATIRPLPKVKGRQISKRRKEKASKLTDEAYCRALKVSQANKHILTVPSTSNN